MMSCPCVKCCHRTPADSSKFFVHRARARSTEKYARVFFASSLYARIVRTLRTRRRCNVGAGLGRWARPYSTLLSRRPFSGTLSGLLSLTLLPLPRRLIVLQFPPLNRYDYLTINPYTPPFSFLSSAFARASLFPRSARILVSDFSRSSYRSYREKSIYNHFVYSVY